MTTAKIAEAAVTSAKLADAAVTSAKLADSAATAAKIADAAVTSAKLADSAVTTAKIANAAVTSAKLADSAVTETKLADDSVSNAKLQHPTFWARVETGTPPTLVSGNGATQALRINNGNYRVVFETGARSVLLSGDAERCRHQPDRCRRRGRGRCAAGIRVPARHGGGAHGRRLQTSPCTVRRGRSEQAPRPRRGSGGFAKGRRSEPVEPSTAMPPRRRGA